MNNCRSVKITTQNNRTDCTISDCDPLNYKKSRSHPEKATTVFLLPFDDPRQLEIKNCHGAFIEDKVTTY